MAAEEHFSFLHNASFFFGADVNDEKDVKAKESSLVDPNQINTTTTCTSPCFHLIKKKCSCYSQ